METVAPLDVEMHLLRLRRLVKVSIVIPTHIFSGHKVCPRQSCLLALYALAVYFTARLANTTRHARH